MTQTTPSSVDAMREALKPFADKAEQFSAQGDGLVRIQMDFAHFRRARDVLSSLSTLPSDGVTIPAGRDVEAAAWAWLENRYGTDADDPVDRVYDASEMVDAFLAGQAAKTAAPKAPPVAQAEGVVGDTWPDEWKRDGFNHAITQAQKALRYLASNDRPAGGEQFPNSASCYMIADELEVTRKRYAALSATTEQGEGE